MNKQKRKNDTLVQRRTLSFIALSVLSYAIAWSGTSILINLLFRLLHLSMKKTHALGFTISTLFIAIVQIYLVERLFKNSMRRWLWYTMIGILITLPLYRNDPEWPTTMTIFLSPLFPVTLAQTVWLWRRVRRAWLWPLASIAGKVLAIISLYFTPLIGSRFDSSGAHLLMSLPYGLVQGLMLHYLWSHPKQTEKAKVDFDMADQSNREHDRIERLQTSEHLHASLPQPTADASTSKHRTQ